ncbi:hypothetical protein H4R24_003521 [Coemansia sp. RSA 988]|nr:hypothetical protein H4R24_003521 [Coemansia sp. RSA 988]
MKRPSMDLAEFLANAPSLFGEEASQDEEIDPNIARGKHEGAIRRFDFDGGDTLSCIRWDSQFHITSTDIIRALVHRFRDIQRPVVNMKKFEEGVFSDLRSLKPGVDARLELPRSEFLELLYKHHCVRTQKKQKVFYWCSVPHDMLFRDALERDLKREAMGIEPTTKIAEDADPASFVVIGGVELPLSVPPTLAAHMYPSASSHDISTARVRVSTALVTSSTAAARLRVPAAAHGHKPAENMSLTSQPALLSSKNIDAQDVECSDNAPMGGALGVSDRSTGTMKPTMGVVETPDMPKYTPHSSNHEKQIATSHQQFSAQQDQPISSSQFGALANTGSQPSLSEYISARSASSSTNTSKSLEPVLINDSWTNANFRDLHKKASELYADYNEYHPTPTPHHSPKEGAACRQDLLELLSSDPNAFITQDNVGDFSSLLDQILGSSGQIKESTTSQDGNLFAGPPFSLGNARAFLPQTALSITSQSANTEPTLVVGRSASASSMDVDMGPSTNGTCANPAVAMVLDSASPSMASSSYMTPNQTPDVSGALPHGFGSVGAMSLNEINSILASVDASRAAPVSIPTDTGSRFTEQSLGSLFPMFDNSADGPQSAATQLPTQTPFVAVGANDTRVDVDEPKSMGILKQLWLSQRPGVAPTPRSTRFSRFHPYLKSIARIAHRGSSSSMNRVPSTADPNVAAAAVNAMAPRCGYNAPDVAAGPPNSGAGLEQQGSSTAALFSMSAQSSQTSCLPLPGGAEAAPETQSFEALNHAKSDIEDPTKLQGRTKSKHEDGEDLRRYSCTFAGCTKQFKRHEHLKRHFRTHTGERPYKCPAPGCGKVFARMDNLSQHIRTHVNRKTANRRSGHKTVDNAIQSQVQSLTSDWFSDANTGGEHAAVAATQGDAGIYMDASDELALKGNLSNYSEDGPGDVTGASSYASASGFAAMGAADSATFSMSPWTGTTRVAMPDELALLNREWLDSNIGNQQMQAIQQQQQQQQSMQSPLIENNAVTMLRKISRNNRTRVPSGVLQSTNDPRPRDEQAFAPYNPTTVSTFDKHVSNGADLNIGDNNVSGSQGSNGSASTDFMRSLSIEANTSLINPVWLASFLAQGQQPALGTLGSEGRSFVQDPISSRPPSLKRHLDDEDIMMADGSGDDTQRLQRLSDGEHQGAPVTGGMSTNKFVRSDMTTKSHITSV